MVVPSLESAHYVAEMEAAAADLSQDAEPDLIRRTDTRQKHYSRAELRRRVTQPGLGVLTLRRIHYRME